MAAATRRWTSAARSEAMPRISRRPIPKRACSRRAVERRRSWDIWGCGSPIIHPQLFSRCYPFITMMQAAELRDFADRAMLHDLPLNRALLFQREVRARSVVIVEVRGQSPLQMTTAQDHEVIQALPSY